MYTFLLAVLLSSPPTTVIRHVTVIPMDSERTVPDQTVVLRDGRILSIGDAGTVAEPDDAAVIDGTGKYLLPGIAEMHAHVPPSTRNPEYMSEVLFLYKANGITTVRGMLGHPLHLQLRGQAARGEIVSPRIFTSGPSINGQSAPTPEVAEVMVRAQKAAGVWNVPTQSLIEHLLGPDSIEELASRPEMAYVPPDMLQSWMNAKQGYLDNPNFSVELGIEFIRLRRALIAEMNRQDAGLLLGSDAPQIFNVPGFAIHHEMRMMAESGMTPYEVLRAGTVNVAMYFDERDSAGTVEAGKRADLVLLDANPLADIAAMRSVHAVWMGGYPLMKAEIDARLEQIRGKYAE